MGCCGACGGADRCEREEERMEDRGGTWGDTRLSRARDAHVQFIGRVVAEVVVTSVRHEWVVG